MCTEQLGFSDHDIFIFLMIISSAIVKTCAWEDEISGTPENESKNQNQLIVPLDGVLERRTMTSIPETSARGSLIL